MWCFFILVLLLASVKKMENEKLLKKTKTKTYYFGKSFFFNLISQVNLFSIFTSIDKSYLQWVEEFNQ